jgi:hypothetical protein
MGKYKLIDELYLGSPLFLITHSESLFINNVRIVGWEGIGNELLQITVTPDPPLSW